MKTVKRLIVSLCVLPLIAACSTGASWRDASRESAGIAPDPVDHPEAIIQVYAADAWGWRGWFAVHTWIAAKRSDADRYRIYEVVGWRHQHGRPVVRAYYDKPDRLWFGSQPEVVLDLRGPELDGLIDKVELAVANYPWPTEYRVFPGPNSNTFVAWVGDAVPELGLDLPFSAIGSGYASKSKSANADY
jgi:hypothetical protein